MIDTAVYQKQVLAWYRQYGRKTLPWQLNKTPYKVWVSEIMLQQTQVKTVIPYFERFIARFPTIESLAMSSLDDVMQYWSGLGYYARGRNLHLAAQKIMKNHCGQFPSNITEVQALPGIGPSTAGAILSFSLQQHHTILDGNVKRVLTRLFCIEGLPEQSQIKQQLWKLADRLTPKKHCAQYNQAIMDIGATICTRSKPSCDICPIQSYCQAYQQGTQHLFPTKKKAKTKPKKSCLQLLITDQSKSYILLEKRPNQGIWGGLWVLPELNHINMVDDFIHETIQLRQFTQQAQTAFTHQFTHFDLKITPIEVRTAKRKISTLKQPYAWHPIESISTLGLSKPTKMLLAPLQQAMTV